MSNDAATAEQNPSTTPDEPAKAPAPRRRAPRAPKKTETAEASKSEAAAPVEVRVTVEKDNGAADKPAPREHNEARGGGDDAGDQQHYSDDSGPQDRGGSNNNSNNQPGRGGNRRDRNRNRRERGGNRNEGGGNNNNSNNNNRNAGGGRRDRNAEYANYEPDESLPVIDLNELKRRPGHVIIEIAEEFGIELSRVKKTDLIFQLLRNYLLRNHMVTVEGVLELTNDGFGFLRNTDDSWDSGSDDIYVSPSQIRRFSLRKGDTIKGTVRPPANNERYFALGRVDTINDEPPEASRRKVPFENLTALFPQERLRLERGNGSTEDITARIIDLVSPIGAGQRGLIVAPPKAGKTLLLQNIAQSIAANYPDHFLIVLLIDERPEEVTDMQRTVRGEVVSSTFDQPASRHVQVAEMAIEKAKRLVEHKRDVVILLDSITRLARAYNTVAPSSGKVLTGGVDANALQKPKRFFGAARNVEEGGSLTIIATCLVETGSKMDEVIYEEFKGTGNLELVLERRIAEKRIFPAINVTRSGTRREELLMDPAELQGVWVLRKALQSGDEIGAAELLIDRMKQTKTNDEFFKAMKRN